MCSIIRASVLTGLWVAALALMTVWSVMGSPINMLALPAWAVIVAMVGSVFAVWEMVVQERARIEDIASRAAKAALDYRGMRSAD